MEKIKNNVIIPEDSYTKLIEAFNIMSQNNTNSALTIEKLFEAGLNCVIWPSEPKVEQEWNKLKQRIVNSSNAPVPFRGSGRNGENSQGVIKFYHEVLGIDITPDSTNNAEPAKMIQTTTSKTIGKEIVNYQISHIIEERTSNPYLFTAPWMTCYTPKLIDPFTGHEVRGYDSLRHKFIETAMNRYQSYINKYNELMKSIWKNKNIATYLKDCNACRDYGFNDKNRKTIIVSLSPIFPEVEKYEFKSEVYLHLMKLEWWTLDQEKIDKYISNLIEVYKILTREGFKKNKSQKSLVKNFMKSDFYVKLPLKTKIVFIDAINNYFSGYNYEVTEE